MMKFEEFETPRLILRKWTPETYSILYADHTKEEVMQVMDFETDADYEREKAKVEKGYSMHNRTMVQFQFILKQSGRTAGSGGLHNWLAEHRRAELGYALRKQEFMGQGITTEAMDFIVPYGFREMDLNRMEAYVGPNNIASNKIIQRYGFVQEGLLKEHFFINGKHDDSIVYGLLKKNFDINKYTR